MSFKLLKGQPRTGAVALYDKLIVPPMRIVERLVRPPLGKNVLVIARKR